MIVFLVINHYYQFMHRAEAKINLTALKQNLKHIKILAPQSFVMAVVKANAYGHGIEHIAKTMLLADAFGVACLEEAMALQALGVKKPIVILSAVFSDELSIIAQHGFALVVHNDYQLKHLKKIKLPKPLKVWLKVDTGMHRLGFAPEKIATIYLQLKQNPNIEKDLVLMTHFAKADDLSKEGRAYTEGQILRFYQSTQKLEGLKSLANSAGILHWPQSHADWIRPGLMLYGVAASPYCTAKALKLKPVMTLEARLISIQNFKKGATIGYGGTWKCPVDMPVGIVGIGYGDGYPRYAQNGTPVLIHGMRCPLIGRVSMDMLNVDLRSCPKAKVGDKAVLWGEKLPIEEIAQHANTIPYELLCGITRRVKVIEVIP
jgi:alanine racemase